jgi:hypothetical protein
MAKAKMKRGDKRTLAAKVISSSRLTKKSTPEMKEKVIGKVAKAIGVKSPIARSYTNFLLRNPKIMKASAAAKATAKKATRATSRSKVKAKTSAEAPKTAAVG